MLVFIWSLESASENFSKRLGEGFYTESLIQSNGVTSQRSHTHCMVFTSYKPAFILSILIKSSEYFQNTCPRFRNPLSPEEVD